MTEEIAIKDSKIDLHVDNVQINGASLEIGELTKPEFEVLGHKLSVFRGATQFWIGDWANAIIQQHAETTLKEQCLAVGLNYGTVRTYAMVATKFDVLSRLNMLEQRPELTFSHFHEATQAASPEYTLENMPEGWSKMELRAQIKADAEARTAATAPKPKKPIFSWVRDPRIIAAEDGLTAVATALGALETATQEEAVAKIYIAKLKTRMKELIK